jgi:hypothetical protein
LLLLLWLLWFQNHVCSTFSLLAANSSSPVALQAAGSQGTPAYLPPGLVQQLFGGLLQLLPDLAAGDLQQLTLQLLLRLAKTGVSCVGCSCVWLNPAGIHSNSAPIPILSCCLFSCLCW